MRNIGRWWVNPLHINVLLALVCWRFQEGLEIEHGPEMCKWNKIQSPTLKSHVSNDE